MAAIFRNPLRRVNLKTGKKENCVDANGKTLYSPKWRAVIVNHKGERKTYTFGTNKQLAQKHADMIETREREIKNGVRPVPTPADENATRSVTDVFEEYFKWGRARGGKRNMPWAPEFAEKKERNLAFWFEALKIEVLGDLYGILPKVEEICHTMLAEGRAGKTVSNKVLDLAAFIKWCKKKRKYLTEDPLEELGEFDKWPKTIRRAMTKAELQTLLPTAPRIGGFSTRSRRPPACGRVNYAT